MVGKVGDVVGVAQLERGAGKGADDVAAIGGDLGHEANAGFSDGAIVVPVDHVFAVDGHVLLDWNDSVEALVVGRAVDVHAEGLSVGGEGVAVCAGWHVLEQDAAGRLADVAQTPVNEMDGVRGEGRDNTVDAERRHERDIAVEDGRTDGVIRGGESDTRLGEDGAAVAHAADDEGGRGGNGVGLDGGPGSWVRSPGPHSGLLGGECGRLVGVADGLGVNRRDFDALAAGDEVDGGRLIGEDDVDVPGGASGVTPEDGRRSDAGGEDGAFLG